MEYRNFDEVINAIKARKQKKSCAVVAAESEKTLKAVLNAHEDGIVEPYLIGDEHAILGCLEKVGGNKRGFEIIPTRSLEESAQKAVDMAKAGEADVLVKGHIDTSVFFAPIVNKKNDFLTRKMLTGFSLLEIPTYHKLIAATDAGITIYPTLEQKKIIIENAVEVLRQMGISLPKVAVLAAVETANPKMPETMDAEVLQKMNERGEIRNCIISGPISYDLAVDKEAARIKGFDSPVAGDADLLVYPNITAANLHNKALVVSGRAKGTGFAIGAKTPIVLTSRSSVFGIKYRSLVMACGLTGRQ